MGGFQEVRRKGHRERLEEEAESNDRTSDRGEKKVRGRGMFQLQLRHRSPPVISVSPSATSNVCACVCVCSGAVREHQTGAKASQDACPIIALVVFRQ